MISPIPPPGMDDPWENEFGVGGNNNMQAWRERERRQRTVRLLMMFLLMLLLMDGEEQSQRRRVDQHGHLRRSIKKPLVLEEYLFEGRTLQDEKMRKAISNHDRATDLTKLNSGRNVDKEVRDWATEKEKEEKQKEKEEAKKEDPEDRTKVYHYPWNATGFYRGEWTRTSNIDETSRQALKDDDEGFTFQYATALELEGPMKEVLEERKERVGVFLLPPGVKLQSSANATKAEAEEKAKFADMYEARKNAKRSSAPLFSSMRFRSTDDLNKIIPEEEEETPDQVLKTLTLTKPSGRAAFQFYSRSIPAMKELSLLDGFVKLYDSNAVGYSTRRDVLMRVRGVILHSIGRISMVSSAALGRSALVISEESSNIRRRRLLESLAELPNVKGNGAHPLEETIREDALALYDFDSLEESPDDWSMESVDLDEGVFQEIELREVLSNLFSGWKRDKEDSSASKWMPPLMRGRKLSATEHGGKTKEAVEQTKESDVHGDSTNVTKREPEVPMAAAAVEETTDEIMSRRTESNKKSEAEEEKSGESPEPKEETVETPARSNIVLPYPYVVDDKAESIGKAKTHASRRMPQREFLLEANAGLCEFELNLDVQAIQWTLGEWKTLVSRRVHDTAQVNPSLANKDDAEDEVRVEQELGRRNRATNRKRGIHAIDGERSRSKPVRDQALVMGIVGSIDSPNCDFSATVNATAIRTDWESATGKAINYSFYMMLTCLTQIVVLLRQLLHTQAQSAATRVSLLCIGWQTVLDALLCLGHISLSLGMQPLFTAFASVAFFKLLIFCVIEMKYMAIIMQARNNSNGGQNTTEVMRRQVTLLHLRFYAALMAVLMAFFYAGEQYRTFYVLSLYSFWVPQIILNIVTEAKRPLHQYYIYGMSISRLVAPLYIFAVPNNFLKEVYPDAPSYPFMCQLLVLWVGFQTAVLVAQGRYGARFMIPARFLPPKFDYSRPIPESLLPPGAVPSSPDTSFTEGEVEVQTLTGNESRTSDRHSSTTRNRIKGNRRRSGSGVMNETTTTTTTETSGHISSDHATLDCVICYNGIDVHNRWGYMLAPCDHLFHRDCLVQWMDVKMECPICRTELPSL